MLLRYNHLTLPRDAELRTRTVSGTLDGRDRGPPVGKFDLCHIRPCRCRGGAQAHFPRNSVGARFGGIEGGQSHSSPVRDVQHRVCWLVDLKSVSQPSAEPPKPPLGAPSRTASIEPSQAASPASWSPASRIAKTYPGAPAARSQSGLPAIPSGTRDRRSQALPRPVDAPKCPRNARKSAPGPAAGDQVRFRRSLSGPRDRPTSPA